MLHRDYAKGRQHFFVLYFFNVCNNTKVITSGGVADRDSAAARSVRRAYLLNALRTRWNAFLKSLCIHPLTGKYLTLTTLPLGVPHFITTVSQPVCSTNLRIYARTLTLTSRAHTFASSRTRSGCAYQPRSPRATATLPSCSHPELIMFFTEG